MKTEQPPLLEARNISVVYPVRRWRRRTTKPAVAGVSLTVRAGEALGILGESGSGKSTLALALMGLLPLASGIVRFRGNPIPRVGTDAWLEFVAQAQIVFQEGGASLPGHFSVREAVREPLIVQSRRSASLRGQELDRRVRAALEAVGAGALPHTATLSSLSQGQLQRVGLARAIVQDPALVVCDEPTSSLDASLRARVLNLLARMAREEGKAVLLIAHDPAEIRQVCDRVVIISGGRIVELGIVEKVFQAPRSLPGRLLIEAWKRGSRLSDAPLRLPGTHLH